LYASCSGLGIIFFCGIERATQHVVYTQGRRAITAIICVATLERTGSGALLLALFFDVRSQRMLEDSAMILLRYYYDCQFTLIN